MANIKSSKKDLRRSTKRRLQNTAVKSALKTYVKRVRTSIAEAGTETANPQASAESLRLAIKALDKAAQNGTIHKNQAARRKSRLAKQLHAAQNPAAQDTAAATA